MEDRNQEIPPEENRLEQLQEAIRNSRTAIEGEFAKTANDWVSCFGTRVFIIETYLASPKCRALLSPDAYKEAENRLEQLKQRIHELHEKYQSKEQQPPDDIKKELLSSLETLLNY